MMVVLGINAIPPEHRARGVLPTDCRCGYNAVRPSHGYHTTSRAVNSQAIRLRGEVEQRPPLATMRGVAVSKPVGAPSERILGSRNSPAIGVVPYVEGLALRVKSLRRPQGENQRGSRTPKRRSQACLRIPEKGVRGISLPCSGLGLHGSGAREGTRVLQGKERVPSRFNGGDV